MPTQSNNVSITPRRLGAAALIGWALIMLTTLIFQPARAQDTPPELKPPFKLHRVGAERPDTGVPPLPLTDPIVLSETFGSSFVPLPSLAGTGWHTVNYNLTVNGYTWGRVVGAPITDSVWVASTRFPTTLPELVPGGPYTNSMNALLVYGPLDLSNYGTAVMSFTYRLDSSAGDFFGAAYSVDGANFYALTAEDNSADPTLTQRRTVYVNLAAIARKTPVWLAFYFESNNDDQLGLGAFIEDVVVRAKPLYKVYLPVMRLDPTPTPTPTLTPTPSLFLYQYTFTTALSTDPQFLTWGGKMNYSCGTDCTVIQDISSNGNPNGAINFSMGGLDTIVGTSPNHTIPGNFELSGDFMLVEGKADARFGFIFGASLATFYTSGDDVIMDPSRNYYKFDLNIDPANETVIKSYRLQRYDNGAATNLQSGTDFPAGVVRGLGQWNTIRVVRQNNNIQVYVNGWPAINLNDGTFTGERKFGVDLHSRALNNNNNPLKIRFDNITVKQLP
jgi:hypothetical protein